MYIKQSMKRKLTAKGSFIFSPIPIPRSNRPHWEPLTKNKILIKGFRLYVFVPVYFFAWILLWCFFFKSSTSIFSDNRYAIKDAFKIYHSNGFSKVTFEK